MNPQKAKYRILNTAIGTALLQLESTKQNLYIEIRKIDNAVEMLHEADRQVAEIAETDETEED